jgi:hypothetical protein
MRRIDERKFLAPKKVAIVAFLHEYLPLYADEMPDRGKIIWQLPSHMSLRYIYEGYLRKLYGVGTLIRYRYTSEEEDAPRSKPLLDTTNKAGALMLFKSTCQRSFFIVVIT